jgi:hypothetical protein
LSRRSFLGTVAGGAIGLSAGGAGASPPIRGVTDTDSGARADHSCNGRGGPGSRKCPSSMTDADTGPKADPPRRGRDNAVGFTDSDAGPNYDPTGRGWGRARIEGRPGTGALAPRAEQLAGVWSWRIDGTAERRARFWPHGAFEIEGPGLDDWSARNGDWRISGGWIAIAMRSGPRYRLQLSAGGRTMTGNDHDGRAVTAARVEP